MLEQRKGITPVIAIVLLLLVTVGAVGVVYTQFQNIAGSGDTTFADTAKKTELTITSVSKNNDSEMNLTITNNQGSVTINTTQILDLYFYPNQASPSAAIGYSQGQEVQNINFSESATATCFQPGHEIDGTNVILDPGESLTCDTNAQWPSATKYVGLDVRVQGGSKSWSKQCDPLSTRSETC
ncbi:MAG: hypothetical protein ABEK16_00745 [Candidatus Nanohalobium sp.]